MGRAFQAEEERETAGATLADRLHYTFIITYMDKHTPVHCTIRGCQDEATRRFEWASAKDGTFYLCSDHQTVLSPEDDMVHVLKPDTGELQTLELVH